MNWRLIPLFIFLAVTARGQSAQSVYSDTLDNGWVNWSWATVNVTNSTPVHSGSKSIAVTISNAWQAVYMHHDAPASGSFTGITFWAHGGTGAQQL